MKLDHYQELAESIIEEDRDRQSVIVNGQKLHLYDEIDTAINGGNDLPETLSDLPWMVEYKSGSVHDAYAAARKTMSASKVQITVMPPFANPMNAEEAKKIEDVLEYNLWLTNRKAARRPMNIIADYTSRYLACAVEVIDNELQYKGRNDARSKAVKRSGRFTWKVLDPRVVHPRFSDSILEDVLVVRQVSAQDVIDKFGEDDPAVKKLINDISEKEDSDLRETFGTLYTYYDYEVRVEWFSLVENDETGGGSSAYELINKEHGLGFIPFECAYEEDPILKTVIQTGQLDNLNILLSMRYALIAATVSQARGMSKTASGEGVPVDYTNPAAQVQLKLNEDYQNLPPPMTDPNINTIIQDFRSEIASSTSVSRILSSMDSMASNTPYSTISSLMQSALQSLIDIRHLVERVVEGCLCIEMYWAKYSKTPINGQRMKKVGLYDDTKMMGAMLTLDPQYSDDWPDKWIVTVQLRPNSPTDRQERLNFSINSSEKLLLPRASAFELAGIEDDPDVSLMEYGDEQTKIAEIQAEVKRILLKPDIEAKQAEMQMQQQAQQQAQQAQAQAQPQQQPQDPNAPPQGGSMGQSPATGGVPDAMNNPGATREQITGQSAQMTSGGG